jgi:hypothetical protein
MPLCHDRNDLVRAAFASNISVVRFKPDLSQILIQNKIDLNKTWAGYNNLMPLCHDNLVSAVFASNISVVIFKPDLNQN